MNDETMSYVGKSIGLRRLVWFPIISESEEETVYGSGLRIARGITIAITPTFAEATLESDDAIEDEESALTSIGVAINVNQLTDPVRAALLGHKLDADGGILTTADDTAPYGALAWEELLSRRGGTEPKYKRVLLYRGRFQEYAENAETKRKNTLNMQTPTINGVFIPRLNDNRIKYSMRQDTPKYNETKFGKWFDEPQDPAEGEYGAAAAQLAAPAQTAVKTAKS